MAKFKLTAAGYIQNAFRSEGAVLDLDCRPAKKDEKPEEGEGIVTLRDDGSVWIGKQVPPASAKIAPKDAKAEAAAPDKAPPKPAKKD